MPSNPPEIDSLFSRALQVTNMSIDVNSDFVPWKQLFDAQQRLLTDRKIALIVYDEEPQRAVAHFVICWTAREFERLDCSPEEAEITCWISRSQLADFANDLVKYINHPGKLNWDWLKSYLKTAGRAPAN